MKTLIIAIFLVAVIGLVFFLLPGTKTIKVSNAAFMELVENNKMESVLFTSGNDEVIGYPRDYGALVYTYTDTINDSVHPPELFEMLKKHKDKVTIQLDYAPVDDNFRVHSKQ
jgi:hypothetical protein